MAALRSSPGGAQEMDGPEQPGSQGVFGRGPRMAAAAKWLRHQRFITAAPPRPRPENSCCHGNAFNVMAAL